MSTIDPTVAVAASLAERNQSRTAIVGIVTVFPGWRDAELSELLAKLDGIDDHLEDVDRMMTARYAEILGFGSEWFRPAYYGLLYARGREPRWVEVEALVREAQRTRCDECAFTLDAGGYCVNVACGLFKAATRHNK